MRCFSSTKFYLKNAALFLKENTEKSTEKMLVQYFLLYFKASQAKQSQRLVFEYPPSAPFQPPLLFPVRYLSLHPCHYAYPVYSRLENNQKIGSYWNDYRIFENMQKPYLGINQPIKQTKQTKTATIIKWILVNYNSSKPFAKTQMVLLP